MSDSPSAARAQGGLSIELRSAILQLGRRIRQERTDDAITPSEYTVLGVLAHHGGMTPGKLAEHEQISPPSMTRTVGNLAAKGYVQRSPHPTDRRQVMVELTDAGREIVKATRRRRDAWLSRQLAKLDPDQRATLAEAASIMKLINTPEASQQ